MITVKREDIRLEEQEEAFHSFLEKADLYWVAAFHGQISTGEMALLERSAATPSEALDKLEQAIADLGWVIEQ